MSSEYAYGRPGLSGLFIYKSLCRICPSLTWLYELYGVHIYHGGIREERGIRSTKRSRV